MPTYGGPSTTITTDGHTITDRTILTATTIETFTIKNLYCPPPLTAYGEACITANGTASFTDAKSATMSYNSTVTVTYTPPTTTNVKTTSVATNTRGTTNPFGISLGGPATTITSGGNTITRYSASGGVLDSLTSTASVATNTRGTTNPFGISLGGPATTFTSGGSTFTRYSASGGVLNSLTSTAAATATVAPYKGDAAGRVGGAVGGVAAVGAAALWLL